MTRPSLPTYASSENSAFHPVMRFALERVLIAKGLTGVLIVKPQHFSPTGPIDIVLLEVATGRVALPIEIKRTQSGVRGLGRRQARDYWSNLGTSCSTLFYCASNLELVELFRHDPARPRTSAQRVHLSQPVSGTLGTTPEGDFYAALERCMDEVVDLMLGTKPHAYAAGLTQFQGHIEAATHDPARWHQIFVPACFEYIRGAAYDSANLRALASGWKTASFYMANPARLNALGGALDFSGIFRAPEPPAHDAVAFTESVLQEAYACGKALGRGDDIAELVAEVLRPQGPGIVETDMELAQLLAILARCALGRQLHPEEEAFDPGAGSGRLLTALPLTAFPLITPRQIRANEVEPLFAESLSLRLGLAFAPTISRANAPSVSIASLSDLDQVDLANVRLVVMNPPFLSGVQAAGLKRAFAARIEQITGAPSRLDVGQAALELLFLELVHALVPEGTVIATVFPVGHLHRLSAEVVALRRFLVERFGLTYLATYPARGVFEQVTKQTVLLVGRKCAQPPEVLLVDVQKQVSDLDFNELLANLPAGQASPTYGVEVSALSSAGLLASSVSGWRSAIGAGIKVAAFLSARMRGYLPLGNMPGLSMRRGTVGNKGCTDLTVFHPARPVHPSVLAMIPDDWCRPTLNTTNGLPRPLTAANAPELGLLPPEAAFSAGTPENVRLIAIIDEYLRCLAARPRRGGSQPRREKNGAEVLRCIESDQRLSSPRCVLVPRATRVIGEISWLEEDGLLLSTNIHLIYMPNPSHRMLMASWLLSVFGQLQFEMLGAQQEGLRKVEQGPLRRVLCPDLAAVPAAISGSLLAALPAEPALNFSNSLHIRPTDVLWAEVVAPADPHIAVEMAFELLGNLVDERRAQ